MSWENLSCWSFFLCHMYQNWHCIILDACIKLNSHNLTTMHNTSTHARAHTRVHTHRVDTAGTSFFLLFQISSPDTNWKSALKAVHWSEKRKDPNQSLFHILKVSYSGMSFKPNDLSLAPQYTGCRIFLEAPTQPVLVSFSSQFTQNPHHYSPMVFFAQLFK